MGLFSDLFRRLRPPKMCDLPVEFDVDLSPEGKQLLRAHYTIGSQRYQVSDLRQLTGYGYRVQMEDVQYVPSMETINLIASLQSLNPTFRDDGAVEVEVLPPVLRYLRGKQSVQETDRSRQLTIARDPVRAEAEINFNPTKGLQVIMGFRLDAKSGLVQEKDLPVTPDGGYIRQGDCFVPLQLPNSESARAWLRRGSQFVTVEKIPEFFKRDLVLLKSAFSAVVIDGTHSIRLIDRLPKPRVRVDVSERGWLDFQVGYQVGDHEVPFSTLKKAGASYAYLGDGTFVHVSTKELDHVDRQLREMGAMESEAGFRVPVTCFASIEDFIQQIGGLKEVTAAYDRFLTELEEMRDNPGFRLPQKVEDHLQRIGISVRPYQRSGIHWLDWLGRNRLHGILADDMGLGKTLQTILAMRLGYERATEEERRLHSLVVCPKSVMRHWTREIHRYYPEARICEFHGPDRDKRAFDSVRATIFITSYATLIRDIDVVRQVPFLYTVLDEATQIKNADSRRTEAVKSLNAVHRVCLSGTPVENRPMELWSLFDFLVRGHLGNQALFERRFEQPILNGDHEAAAKLSRRVAPFVLRRLKGDVAKDLPDKLEMTEWCELTDEQRAQYVRLQSDYKGVVDLLRSGERVDFATGILPLLTKLKQVCDHPAILSGQLKPLFGRSNKFDMVVEKIRDIHADGEQVVVFSHFLRTLDLLQSALTDLGIAYIRIDGSTQNRQDLMDQFNRRGVVVALCSIQACGHGINLVAGNHVIHFDRWWNPAVEDQATDRVHRIGQQKTVYVHRVLVEDTIEEKIDALLTRKRGIADLILGGDLLASKQLSRDELLEILKPLV